MLRFIAIFALLVAAASATNKPDGVVVGIISCGSAGIVYEVRVTGCTDMPCQLHKGQTYDVEVDFEPSIEHVNLTVLVLVSEFGKDVEIVHDTVPAGVAPGRKYTLKYPWTVGGENSGFIALKIMVTGVDGTPGEGVVEFCGLGTVEVHDTIF